MGDVRVAVKAIPPFGEPDSHARKGTTRRTWCGRPLAGVKVISGEYHPMGAGCEACRAAWVAKDIQDYTDCSSGDKAEQEREMVWEYWVDLLHERRERDC